MGTRGDGHHESKSLPCRSVTGERDRPCRASKRDAGPQDRSQKRKARSTLGITDREQRRPRTDRTSGQRRRDVVLVDGASMSDLVTSFSQALQGYLANLAFSGEVIRYTQILNLLLDQPLLVDVSGFTVNGASANLVVGVKQIATLGTVTFT